MKLKDYLKNNRIRQVTFAEKLNIKKAHLSQVVNDKATPSLKLALLIEDITWGAVRPRDFI